ncbi:hypothetical protein SORBI_3007G181701 [Sorghum bicolor]|uniref:Uncharacterized protein n=1 Tax=Sorghum bicolor TaxID=4558 RepID=A0A1Z5RAM7_SORBI|nr:hypothetical protein SORBI_3007G181701 [Sorghum bicolor]
MAVRTVACNEARFIIEEDKWCFMDLKFCDIAQIGRDTRCRDEINYEELAGLFECWTPCYYIKDCSTGGGSLRTECLVDILQSNQNERANIIPEELRDLLKQLGTYL